MVQNDFRGSFVGKNNGIKTFHCDTHLGTCLTVTVEEGYLITLHSSRRQLWSIQSLESYLVGIGDPFSNEQYCDYLSVFPDNALDKLHELFYKYEFSSNNPIMFGLNNVAKIIDCRDGSLYIALPDGSSMIYDNGDVAKEIALRDESYFQTKTLNWVRSQINFIRKIDKHWKDVAR